ncbi:MAG: hypothetical protein CMC08_02275 [Flavobacteriaceae bacterium]|nr:hypothetical protein [Flavobacteriaceae bacterium]
MNVRLVTPALSLLLLLSCSMSWAINLGPEVRNNTKLSEKQQLALSKPDVNSLKRSTYATFVKNAHVLGNSSVAHSTLSSDKIENLETTEVFSYKNESINTTSSNARVPYNEATASVIGASGFTNGLYYGFILALLLLNGISYFLFEEKLFLYFSLTLAGFITVFFVNDGLLSLLTEAPVHLPTLSTSLLVLGVGCMAVFSHYYLKSEETFKKLKYVSLGLFALATLFALPNWVAPSQTLLGISNAALMAILANYLILGIAQFSSRNYAKFFVVAMGIPLLFMIDFFVFQKLSISFLNTGTIHLKIALLVEVLILTYAIVYRMRAIKEENEMRQTEMRIFLKRQEMLNRESVAKLMQDVYLENLIMQHDLDGLEIKLLQYISEGKENEKIARKLKLTEEEIDELTKELYHKLEIGEQIKQDYRMVDQQPDYIYN